MAFPVIGVVLPVCITAVMLAVMLGGVAYRKKKLCFKTTDTYVDVVEMASVGEGRCHVHPG